MTTDPFEEVLQLEDNFYRDGYQQGSADGAQAGKIEGRTLGLENGYKKFVESGRLYGKTVIWANRLSLSRDSTAMGSASTPESASASTPTCTSQQSAKQRLSLPNSARLQKNARILYALVEPSTLSTANTDEAVSDFDERIKSAHGKARIMEKMTGDYAAKTRLH